MMPNTVHYVLTISKSINFGRHYYCMSSIDKSCMGIFHQAILAGTITNVEHQEIEEFLRRLLLMNVDDYMNGGGKLVQYGMSLIP
jgi:hypothetical protein